MTPFKALPKKHEPFVLARIEEAYEAGCTAVQETLVDEERQLSPDVDPGDIILGGC